MSELKGSQYMPFDALEGFREEIAKRNIVYIDKPLISDDMAQDINRKLCILRKGDMISFKYYNNGAITHLTGEVKKIDVTCKKIIIKKTIINFKDILEIY